MDKQKQIEEMAKELHDLILDTPFNGTEASCDKIAEELLKHYQPKIPENSVVITREEYDELQVGKDFDYGYHEGYKNTEAYYENFKLPKERKETAEKFARRLKEKLHYDTIPESGITDERNVFESIDEICKEITEGEKEISNETV